ncbi:MAG: DNA topoisomerase VI subunit B [Candidatus Aenigmatarchaeota archaeon]
MAEQVKNAQTMAADHKEVSISEFFEKNRHLLGYDNKIKALMIMVKEAVDNSLDACEEARILPDIYVKIEEIEKEKYKVVTKDNGPGIMKKQIPKIFGTLLYGSKFHRLRQSRGQQGLGISVAVLYSQLTSGQPTEVISSTGDGVSHKYMLKIDVKKNEPVILSEENMNGDPWHGLQVTFVCEGSYREHKQGVLEYIKETAICNPFANITFDAPSGRYEFKRTVERLPSEPKQIKPHLYGVEVGILSRMLKDTKARSVSGFLTSEFTRIGSTTANQICQKAGVDSKISPRKVEDDEVVNMIKAIREIKLSRPPTDCLSPLGNNLIKEGLIKELNPEFVATISRPPTVYRGWPFLIEAGIAYGGSITDTNIMRFANRVPLLYQQGDCVITKAAQGVDWKRYKIEADKLPKGPIILFVHMASVWVPFTSESKEAVASYSIILKEVKLALQEVARKLSIYLSGMRRAKWQAERRSIFERYANETAIAISELTGENREDIEKALKKIVEERISEAISQEEMEEENVNGKEETGDDGDSESET